MFTNKNKTIFSAFFGNLFEHYDAALFTYLSPFLAGVIFPGYDGLSALVMTYAMIPLSMIARPIGAFVYGVMGDRYGREKALSHTLFGMAWVSFAMAFIPTFLQAGLFAPWLFCLGRGLQNFFSAGETMGGAIFILEKTEDKWHDLLSSIFSSSAIGGHLLASFGVFILGSISDVAISWRLLYLLGAVTAFFGYKLRRSTPTSQFSKNHSKPVDNLKSSLWQNRQALLLIIICSGFAQGTFSMALVLMNGFIPLVADLTKLEVMKMNTCLLVFDFLMLPVFGYLASKVGREKMMLALSLLAFILGIPLMSALKEAGFIDALFMRAVFVVIGVGFFAPFHAWAQKLVPANNRYIIVSMGYAIGSQLLGSPTAAIAVFCYQKTGLVTSACWYWMFLAFLSSMTLLVSKKSMIKEKIALS